MRVQFSWGGAVLAVALAGCTIDVVPPLPTPDPPDPPQVGPAWGAPISGGTLLVTHDGNFAVAADPDRDRVLTIDMSSHEVVADIPLQPGDEPGRVVEDGAGRIHIALRRGGGVVTLATPSGPIAFRRDTCAEPRGIAYQAATDQIHVACVGGELVSLPAAGGRADRSMRLDRDLRDIVVVGDNLMITRFKTAEVLTVDRSGAIIRRDHSPTVQRTAFDNMTGEISQADSVPAVAWRAIAKPDGSGAIVVHQRARRAPLATTDFGYGGGMCGGGPIEPTVTDFPSDGTAQPVAGKSLQFTMLAVDVAMSPDGQHLAFAMAGDQSVRVVRTSVLGGGDMDPCMEPPDEENFIFEGRGIPTSVAFTPAGELAVFYPDQRFFAVYGSPSFSTAGWSKIVPGESHVDVGRALFHQMTGAGIACASCHPEAREDGLVWEFNDIGLRRTQMVAGHILERAPYHWDGDMTDLSRLMQEVFVGRMGGQQLSAWEVASLGAWLNTVQAPRPSEPTDVAAVARGKALFNSQDVGCFICHSGAIFTNNNRVNVGTGGTFKVPSLLGVSARAPFIHNGCATTLRDRFTCGGGDEHGVTSWLAPEQIDDLVAYLETL